jgi:hypothetical protein
MQECGKTDAESMGEICAIENVEVAMPILSFGFNVG